jgi:hypothetical protein
MAEKTHTVTLEANALIEEKGISHFVGESFFAASDPPRTSLRIVDGSRLRRRAASDTGTSKGSGTIMVDTFGTVLERDITILVSGLRMSRG